MLWVIEAQQGKTWEPCSRYIVGCGCWYSSAHLKREDARVTLREIKKTRRFGKFRVQKYLPAKSLRGLKLK